MQILIAEDDTALCDALERTLQLAGHRVRLAGDAEAAMRALRSQPPELLVLDYMLPKGDGVQVLRCARERATDMQVLLCSALDDADVRIAHFGLAVDGFLAKPFPLEEFESSIARLAARATPNTVHASAHFGPLRCDLATGDITAVGQPLDLPADERLLLRLLVCGAGKPVSRDEIASHLAAAAPPSIDLCVARLHDRLRPQALGIAKLRGLGYCLTRV